MLLYTEYICFYCIFASVNALLLRISLQLSHRLHLSQKQPKYCLDFFFVFLILVVLQGLYH